MELMEEGSFSFSNRKLLRPVRVWDMNHDGVAEVAVLDRDTNQQRIFDVSGANLFRVPWGTRVQSHDVFGSLGSEAGGFELVAPTGGEIRFFRQP